jgi:hypothetical protein
MALSKKATLFAIPKNNRNIVASEASQTGIPNDRMEPFEGIQLVKVQHHAGQAGGSNPMRDIPCSFEMPGNKQFDAKTLATTAVALEGMLDAHQQASYRVHVDVEEERSRWHGRPLNKFPRASPFSSASNAEKIR